eukprot:4630205-Ditylum_brightwellii.AAC.3
MNVTTPHTALSGEEGDISDLCKYQWYEWCYFQEKKMGFLSNKEKLDNALGPSQVLQCSLRLMNASEIHSEREIKKCKFFDDMIEKKWGSSMNPPELNTPNNQDPYENYKDDDEVKRSLPEVEETVD